ncbi:MAG: desulfoferrodoxin family protein [Desulforegulaceae bacterium]|nr:desulfoferrodoxin family protein [Desulforegulaceae bacterium]
MGKNCVFQCDICGNLVSVLRPGKGKLECCGEKMFWLKPKSGDPASEKHLPFIKETDSGFEAKTGKHPHPMVKSHYIGFLQAVDEKNELRHFFRPGENPKLKFAKTSDKMKVSSYCLIHGVYESKV